MKSIDHADIAPGNTVTPLTAPANLCGLVGQVLKVVHVDYPFLLALPASPSHGCKRPIVFDLRVSHFAEPGAEYARHMG